MDVSFKCDNILQRIDTPSRELLLQCRLTTKVLKSTPSPTPFFNLAQLTLEMILGTYQHIISLIKFVETEWQDVGCFKSDVFGAALINAESIDLFGDWALEVAPH